MSEIKMEMGNEGMTLKVNKGIGRKRFEEMAWYPQHLEIRDRGETCHLEQRPRAG